MMLGKIRIVRFVRFCIYLDDDNNNQNDIQKPAQHYHHHSSYVEPQRYVGLGPRWVQEPFPVIILGLRGNQPRQQ